MTAHEQRVERAVAGHREVFGSDPDAITFAPGRVNLIGEHTDYNGGLVLPVAIGLGTVVAVSRTPEPILEVASTRVPGQVAVISMASLEPAGRGWLEYVAGSVAVSPSLPLVSGGLRLWIDSDVPVGAGLSSSAALECAVLLAVDAVTGASTDPMALALAAQRAEHGWAGVPCGIMDQAASMLGRADHAVLLDSDSLAVEYVPLHLAEQHLALLLINTNAHHELSDGGYADRRAACERAADLLGVTYLADVGVGDISRVETLPEPERSRARHVISEHSRVREAVAAFEARDLSTLARLFDESHWSLSRDFDVSCPELDLSVPSAQAAGAVATRMTGGGFGGSTVSLVRESDVEAVSAAVVRAFSDAGMTAPTPLVVAPADGARVLA